MFKNKNQIIGGVLIAALFIWATVTANMRAQEAQAEAQKVQAIEKAKQDSLAAIKNPHSTGTPELRAAPTAPAQVQASATTVAAVSKDSTKDSNSVALVAIQPRNIVVETDHFWMTLDNRGAKIRSVVAKSLASPEGVFPELIQDTSLGALSLKLDEFDFDKELFAIDSNLPDTLHVQNPTTLRFDWKNAQGFSVTREYRFTKSSQTVRQVNHIANLKPRLYTLEWKGGLRETEKIPESSGLMGGSYFFSEVVFNNTYNVERHTLTEQTWFNKNDGKTTWAGLRRKYIAMVLNWDGESEASIGATPIELKKPDLGTYALTVSDHLTSDSLAYDLVVLPLLYGQVEDMGEDYHKIIVSGWEWIGGDKWFVGLAGLLLDLLNWFYSLIPNYGVAIILLTLLMKLITMPLTVKQLRSTREMQRHKPAMDEIRLRNRANPAKMQQELMEYYKQNGVNPFAAMFGCFTMFLQMPVFIGLFVVLGRAMELRFAPFAGWVTDLSAPDVIVEAIKVPFIFPQGLTILPFVMAVTTYFQTKQTITDPNQKMMIYLMPGMMLLFSTVMPSGLIVYWIVSNLFSIVQYWLMTRNMGPLVQPKHPHMQNKARKNEK